MASASTVTMYSDTDIEVKVLAKCLKKDWYQVQFRFTWSDGSEIACFAHGKAVAGMEKLERDRIYIMTIPASCVKPVTDTKKSGIEQTKEIRLNKSIQWTLSKNHWPTKTRMDPVSLSAINQKDVGDVFDVIGYVLEDIDYNTTSKIPKRLLLLGSVSDGELNTVPVELLGPCANTVFELNACLAIKGATLSEYNGQRTVTTKLLSCVVVNPTDAIVSVPPPPTKDAASPTKRCLPMIAQETISVRSLQEEMACMIRDFMKYKENSDQPESKRPPMEKRCSINVTLDPVDETIFQRNMIINTSPPTFMMLTSACDDTGSLQSVKIWTTAVCVFANCTPTQFLARWKKMEDVDERKQLVEELNTAFQHSWTCSAQIALWDKHDGTVVGQVNINNCTTP